MIATFHFRTVSPPVLLKTTCRLKIDASNAASSSPQPRKLRRRRRLRREDPKLRSQKDGFLPFLERQARLIREDGKDIGMHVEQLTLQSENKFALVREIAEEANAFLLNNPEEAIFKKPVLKVISDRINEAAGRRVVADAYGDAVEQPVEDMGEFTLH